MTSRDGLTLVLMGGWTHEKEVSRNSGRACHEAACSAGWNAEMLEVDRDLPRILLEKQPARVFNALHGQVGEDGNIQGLLNLMQIPYTHSGLLASSIAMDKPATKNALAPLGIVFPDDLDLSIDGDRLVVESDGAVVVKPRNDGSSVGVVLAENADDLPPFYDYEAKYSDGGSSHELPAQVPAAVADLCMEWSSLAHRGLGCRGVSRSDFRWDDKNDRLFMLEINTQPGMTGTSLVPEQAAYCGISMVELVSGLLEAAQCD